MLYLTCTTITSVDLAQYGVALAEDWVSVECGTMLFNLLFNSISFVIGLRKADCERLNVMKCCLGLQKLCLQLKSNPATGCSKVGDAIR